MRTLLCLIVCLTMPQAAHGQEVDGPPSPSLVSGPQLIPALPLIPSAHEPIREARLPRVEPTAVVPAAATPTGEAVRRAGHVEPAAISGACQCDHVGRALTIGLPGGFGVSLGESSDDGAPQSCCSPQWAQWWLDRVATYLGGGDNEQSLALSACKCTDGCKCMGKCGCDASKRCSASCSCGGTQTVQTPAADEKPSNVLPPCGKLCHVETAGGNYFGRLRSLTADWIVLDDEPNETCHWIPSRTLHCLSVYPESSIEDEAADGVAKPDAVTFRGEQRDMVSRTQATLASDLPAVYEEIPQPEPLPLHAKVVYSQGSAEGTVVTRARAAQAAAHVPQGKRLFTLGFPWSRVMQLEPGDKLDLITVLTVQTPSGYPQVVSRTFAHNVEVADVEAGEGDDAVLSLLLTPEQCDLAAVAAESGVVLFCKRNPSEPDSSRESKGATLRKLLGSAVDELDMGEQTPVFAIPRLGMPGRPPVPVMGGAEPFAMPGAVAWPHPGEFGPEMAGPPPVPGCPIPDCMGPAAGMPPFAAAPHGFMPLGAGGPMPFGPPPAMPTFAPSGMPAPELPPHDPDAPRLEPSHPTAPGLPAPKTVYLPDPPAKGKSKPIHPPAGFEPEKVSPPFEPIKPAEAKPLKTSQALPGGRMIRPVASDIALLAVPPVPPAEGAVQQAAAVMPATPDTAAKPRYQLRCVVEMASGSQSQLLTESATETADEATTTIGELEFKFRVQPLDRREVQLTFRDPMGMLQVVRAREGDTLTLPWRSEKPGRQGDVRVTVARVTENRGEVAAVVYEEQATLPEAMQVRTYHAADLVGIRAPSVPVLARSLYARRLLDDGPKTSDEAHAGLLNLVRAVDPDSWQPQGEGSVHYLPESMSLVVRQVPENHERIAELFDQLRTPEPPASSRVNSGAAGSTNDAPRQSSRRNVPR